MTTKTDPRIAAIRTSFRFGALSYSGIDNFLNDDALRYALDADKVEHTADAGLEWADEHHALTIEKALERNLDYGVHDAEYMLIGFRSTMVKWAK